MYKKYLKIGGKKYGPYLYESYRDEEGIVRKRYKGIEKKHSSAFFIFLSVMIIALISSAIYISNPEIFSGTMSYISSVFSPSISGQAVFDFKNLRVFEDKIIGDLQVKVKSGELIPENTKIILEQAGETREFNLNEFIEMNAEGNYYAENIEISGSGKGYGFIGEKRLYPNVYFTLVLQEKEEETAEETAAETEIQEINETEQTETSQETTQETATETEQETETQAEEETTDETATEAPIEQETATTETQTSTETSSSSSSESSSSISSSDSSGGESGGITGGVVSELGKINSVVNANQPFTYKLNEKTAFIEQGSVYSDNGSLSDDILDLKISSDEAIVTTDYVLIEQGFGKEFLDGKMNIVRIPLENLNINATNGVFTIKLVYEGEILTEITKEISAGEIVSLVNETISNETEEIEIIENLTFSIKKNISDIAIEKNSDYALNLDDYFNLAEEYNSSTVENISLLIEGNTLKLTPEENFTGEREVEVYAYSGNDSLMQKFSASVSELNLSINNLNITTKKARIVVGKPVKWIKTVKIENETSLEIEIPKEAENISIKTGKEASQSLQDIEEYNENIENTERTESIGITGQVSLEIQQEKGIFTKLYRWFKFNVFTGNVVANVIDEAELNQENSITETDESKIVDVSDVVNVSEETEIAVEYYTEAPTAEETNISEGKEVIISAPDELNYTDILAYSELDNKIRLEEKNKIKLIWKASYEDAVSYGNLQVNKSEEENLSESEAGLLTGNVVADIGQENNSDIDNLDNEINNMNELGVNNEDLISSENITYDVEVEFDAYDLDGNNLIDYIEWNVPHLSEQVYEIIYITKAEKLDSERNFIEDIYEQVKAKDGNYALIENGNYVRVLFERNLTFGKDMTIYAKGLGNISVYNENDNLEIGKFDINSENIEEYKIYPNYTNNNVYDLLVSSDLGIEIDYIVDPVVFTFISPTPIDGAGITTNSFVANASIYDDCGEGGAIPTWYLDGAVVHTEAQLPLCGDPTTYYYNYTYTSLSEGNHTYSFNEIPARTIYYDIINPNINFTNPTPSNASTQSANSIYVNISSNDSSPHFILNQFDNTLVSWWRMDNINASGDPVDYFGRNNASKKGTAVQNYGQYGKGFDLDGKGYMRVDNIKFIPDTNLSVFAWVVPNNTGGGEQHVFDFKGDSSATRVQLYKPLGGSTSLTLLVNAACIGGNTITISSIFTNNIWTHVGYTRVANYSGGYSNFTLYVNGVNRGTKLCNGAFETTTTDLFIGTYSDKDLNWTGVIDEVVLYNRSISPTEINSLMNATNNQYYNNFTRLSDGNHTFRGYVVDKAGNLNSTELRTVAIDATFPTFSNNKTDLTASTILGSNVYFNITITEASPSSYIFSWYNGTDWENTTDVYSNGQEVNATKTINVDIGDINWTWYANDTLGNLNQSQIYGITLTADDNIPPRVTVVYPVNGSYYSLTSITFNLSVVDNVVVSSCLYSLNSGANNFTMSNTTASAFNATNSSIGNGVYTAKFYCNDTNGNLNNSEQIIFGVDTTYPEIIITYPISGGNYTINVTGLNYTITETNPQSCWYSTDLGITNSTSVTAGTNWTGLSGTDGWNNWTVYCNDTSGNKNSSRVEFYSTYLTRCGNLSQANQIYTLQNNITGITETCFNIIANNITIDFNGFNITGDGAEGSGIGVSSSDYNSTTIKNGEIYNFNIGINFLSSLNNTITNITASSNYYGIRLVSSSNNQLNNITANSNSIGVYLLSNSNNNQLNNITASSNTDIGISFVLSSNNNLTNSNINSNTNSGIRLSSTSNDNLIYNNIFNNTYNTNILSSSSYWNITLTAGTNIIGGNYIGGNFWTNSTGTGYSNTCWDRTGDYLCDDAYQIDASNYDYLPLTFNSDTTYPGISITSPANNTNSSDVNLDINYSVSDTNLQACWYSNDTYSVNTTLANCVNITTIIWSEGQHNVTIWANDSAGNTNSSSVRFTIDITAPLITIISPQSMNYSTTTISFNISSNEILSSCLFSLDNFATNYTMTLNSSLTGANYTNSTMAQGTQTAKFYCNDTSGNANSTQQIIFGVDTTYPGISITYPLNQTYNINISAINYTLSEENPQSCGYSVDNGATNLSVNCGTNLTGLISSEGSNTWLVYANDSAGNLNLSRLTFFKDTINPTINFTSPSETPGNYIGRNNILINVTSTDSGSGLKNITAYLYNSTGLVNSSNSSISPLFTNFTNLADGIYYFNATAYDNTGNKNETETINVTIDRTKPGISYSTDTLNDSTRIWQTNIYVNVSVTEANFKNITFNLYYLNNTGINSTTYTSAIYNINWTGLSGEDYKYNVTIYDLAGNKNSTAIRSITLITSQENVSLNSGWNLVSLTLADSDAGTDRNISINSGWNLIGYSSNISLNLGDAEFTNSSGSSSSLDNAASSGKIKPYLAYYDSSPSSVSNRKYKYAASSAFEMDSSSLEKGKGYWVHANQSGNLTLPGVGGSRAGATYSWSKLRFSNGTSEMNISAAGDAGWISTTLQYYGCDTELWDDCATNTDRWTFLTISSGQNITSWEGVFVKSLKDNITLMRQN